MSQFLSQLLQFLSQWSRVDPTPIVVPKPPPIPSPPGRPPGVVDAINAARASAGLTALVADASLDTVAASWALAMASGGGLGHGDFSGRIEAIYPNTAAAEDIAEGQPDAKSVVAAWMGSPPHRANILGDFNRVGVGSARDEVGSIYWCADFVQVG